jgi:hypothetical protein
VRTPTRLYALLDESKISGEARKFFATTLDFRALVIRCWGMRRPPWYLMGIVFPTGGSVGHIRFESIAEAKAAAEKYFGLAMEGWRETPMGEDPGNFVARQYPGFIDWRVTGPVEREPLFRAKLRLTEYVDEDDHDHCTFCWDDFQVQKEEVPSRDRSLQYGFVTEDNHWVCEPCYDDLKDVLQFSSEVP